MLSFFFKDVRKVYWFLFLFQDIILVIVLLLIGTHENTGGRSFGGEQRKCAEPGAAVHAPLYKVSRSARSIKNNDLEIDFPLKYQIWIRHWNFTYFVKYVGIYNSITQVYLKLFMIVRNSIHRFCFTSAALHNSQVNCLMLIFHR